MVRNSSPAYVITTAQRGVSDEQRGRRNRYMVGMGIRTVCFVAAIAANGPLQWILLGGAVFLPYIAVFIANAGREWDKSPLFVMANKVTRSLPESNHPK